MYMKKQKFDIEKDSFHGSWYPLDRPSEKGIIAMLGDSSDDHLVKCGAKWLHQQGCQVMAMSPDEKDYGHHNYPLERFGKAIAFMKEQGCKKIGVIGASTTGMLGLTAASFYPEITLTIVISPSDFVMEGFYRDGKDGMEERPGDDESSVSWQGEGLPYLPYAYRHPEYWLKIKEEAKKRGDMIASRDLFDESERRHPLQEEEKIKVEHIKGRVICIGAEDDSLWDTCRYIRRMEERLNEKEHDCIFIPYLYEHGTHLLFPESLLKLVLPIGGSLMVGMMFKAGREYKKECRQSRIDLDQKVKDAIREW